MTGVGKVAETLKTSQLDFERLDGELEAAIVFACGAKEAFVSGNTEAALVCYSDARECYGTYITALAKISIDPAAHQILDEKQRVILGLLHDLSTIVEHPHAA